MEAVSFFLKRKRLKFKDKNRQNFAFRLILPFDFRGFKFHQWFHQSIHQFSKAKTALQELSETFFGIEKSFLVQEIFRFRIPKNA